MEIGHPFYQYFEKVYGARWAQLFVALQTKELQVARVNQLSSSEGELRGWDTLPVRTEIPGCHWLSEESNIHPQRNPNEMLDIYIMDPASVMVARALEVQAGDRILDMCAAPGGKSLVLIENLATAGEITCNDLSPERRDRLKKVIQQYVPRSIRDRVWITGKDGVQFGLKDPGGFDRILLDAPCSGERHILENAQAQKDWSPRRTEHLAVRQYSLLCSALLAVKFGGRIVYSTCSISPVENDDVIRKLIKKKKDSVKVLPSNLGFGGEKTEFGTLFLPDQCGFGPLYYSTVQKVSPEG